MAWLGANAPDLAMEATGFGIVSSNLSQCNIHSILRGTIIAMPTTWLILVMAFRSMRLGLISLIPIFIPAIVTSGLWEYLVGQAG